MPDKRTSGKKRGRGRPPALPGGVSDVQVTIRVGSDLMKRIDEARGDLGRAAFIRKLIIETLARNR